MTPAARQIPNEAIPVSGPVIDRDHLARMTFGDRKLERELLELFDRQAAVLLERMQATDAAVVAALAHTLKGSALGIGAVGVARAAAAVEQASDPRARRCALAELAGAIETARAHIAALFRAASEHGGLASKG